VPPPCPVALVGREHEIFVQAAFLAYCATGLKPHQLRLFVLSTAQSSSAFGSGYGSGRETSRERHPLLYIKAPAAAGLALRRFFFPFLPLPATNKQRAETPKRNLMPTPPLLPSEPGQKHTHNSRGQRRRAGRGVGRSAGFDPAFRGDGERSAGGGAFHLPCGAGPRGRRGWRHRRRPEGAGQEPVAMAGPSAG